MGNDLIQYNRVHPHHSSPTKTVVLKKRALLGGGGRSMEGQYWGGGGFNFIFQAEDLTLFIQLPLHANVPHSQNLFLHFKICNRGRGPYNR